MGNFQNSFPHLWFNLNGYLHSGLPQYFGKYIIPYESYTKSKKYLEEPFFHCRVHKSKTNFDCCFSTDGPRLWNGLADDVRLADSLASFRYKLKAHLFQKSLPTLILPPLAVWTLGGEPGFGPGFTLFGCWKF